MCCKIATHDATPGHLIVSGGFYFGGLIHAVPFVAARATLHVAVNGSERSLHTKPFLSAPLNGVSDRPAPPPRLHRVIVMIIGRLSESMPGDTSRLILFPLLRPVLLFWGPKGRQQASRLSASRPAVAAAETKNSPPKASSEPVVPASAPPPVAPAAAASSGGAQGDATVPGGGGGGGGIGEDEIVSSEEALERCLEDLEKLLTAAPAPATLLGLLSGMGVAVPLFRLHCFCAT